MSASFILLVVALILTVISFIENRYPLLACAVLLVIVTLLIGR